MTVVPNKDQLEKIDVEWILTTKIETTPQWKLITGITVELPMEGFIQQKCGAQKCSLMTTFNEMKKRYMCDNNPPHALKEAKCQYKFKVTLRDEFNEIQARVTDEFVLKIFGQPANTFAKLSTEEQQGV